MSDNGQVAIIPKEVLQSTHDMQKEALISVSKKSQPSVHSRTCR